MNTRGEKIVENIFRDRYNLRAEKITESATGSADFFLYSGEKKIAVCEVKDIEDIEPSQKTGWKRETPDAFWSRRDNAPQRIRKKIYEAYKQLKKYDLPKILVLVNFCLGCDALDLQQAVVGYLPYSGTNTSATLIADVFKISLERIRPIMDKIDLYIYLDHIREDKITPRYFRHNQKTESLLAYFGRDTTK